VLWSQAEGNIQCRNPPLKAFFFHQNHAVYEVMAMV